MAAGSRVRMAEALVSGLLRRRARGERNAGKNLASFLATLDGTKRKKGLQGTCKVAFSGDQREQG